MGRWFGTILCGALAALAVGASAETAGRQFTVTMASMNYGRLPAGLKVGDTITWINRDTVPHSVTARNKSFDLRIPPNQKASLVIKTAGAIAIYCIYHPAMRGTLSVAN